MTFDQAARVLDVRLKGLTQEAVRAAYVAALKKTHPDVADNAAQPARFPFDKLREAKDTLLRIVAETDELPQCPRCAGRGVIMGLSKFGSTCKECQGTGKRAR